MRFNVVPDATLVLTLLSFAFDGLYFRSGIERVWHAESTHSADCCSTLLKRHKSAISAAAAIRTGVFSAPFVGVSGGRSDSEET